MNRRRFCRAPALLLALLLAVLTGCGTPEPGEAEKTEEADAAAGTAQAEWMEQAASEGTGQPEADDGADWSGTVVYDGVTYRRRTDLDLVLFLGVDDSSTYEGSGIVVGNNGRSDTLMLFLLDRTTETTRVLQIPRDTMTDVDIYNWDGEKTGHGEMQIALQYSYGNSARRSSFLVKRTVSELLYDQPIDGCFSITMEGIPTVVDTLGGITLTMPADYTEIDARYSEGATVTLDGEAAERFVRYRDIEKDGSNNDRMERQDWFLKNLFRQFGGRGDTEALLDELLERGDAYIETDLDGETMKKLAEYQLTEEASVKLPGTDVVGELHDEYYVDEDALRALVIELFYAPTD